MKAIPENIRPYNWCFWTVVLEKTLKSPLDCKEIQPVHSEEISPGISLEGMMLKLKLQYSGHLMRRVDSLEKTLMLGGIGGRRRRGRQNEISGWHHWLDGHESEWTPGVGDRQGDLVCCDSWGCKELDMTNLLNWLTDWLTDWIFRCICVPQCLFPFVSLRTSRLLACPSYCK